MVTSRQIVKGLAMWVDSEILPMLHGGTKYGAGVVAALLAKQGEGLLDKAKGQETVKALGLVRDGEFDLDVLRTAMIERFPEEGLRIEAAQINALLNRFLGKLGPVLNIQVEGGVTFHKADVEKLYNYIMGG